MTFWKRVGQLLFSTGYLESYGEKNMNASIQFLSNGKFGIIDRSGTTVATYARARDARRGATRRGYAVA